MTEKSAASEACLPSFPTIPTPGFHRQIRSKKRREVIRLTNVSSLDHTYVVSSVPNTAYALLGMFSDKTSDISLLGRRTPARNHSGELGSDLDEFVRKQVQTELDSLISFVIG